MASASDGPYRVTAPARRAHVRRLARRVVGGLAGALGYEVVRRHYYSPVPLLDDIPPGVWTRRSELAGVAFDLDAALAFTEAELGPAAGEYRPPRAPTGDPRDFHLDNSFYADVDAQLLYAFVQHLAPRRILELGSGMSSLVIADARARDARHVICDPYPRDDLRATLASVAEVRPLKVTDVPLSLVDELEAGDVLFVDTTHTVKLDSDVNRVVLDLLPRLAPGVVVHFHDIFLPWEYPREFVVERRFFWAEQYLLQAFLAHNPTFEILCPVHALWRDRREALVRLVGDVPDAARPSAFWMRRTPL